MAPYYSHLGLIPGLGEVGSARGRGWEGQGRRAALVESGGAAALPGSQAGEQKASVLLLLVSHGPVN